MSNIYTCQKCGKIKATMWEACDCMFRPDEPVGKSALDTQEGGDHYKKYKIQPVEFCQKNKIPYCEANVIKYVTRHNSKNGIEDLNKAIHYLELLKEIEYGGQD